MSSREKRKRRQAKQVLTFGRKAAPVHKSKSGRTGQILSKQLKEKSK
jgi:hypothetical protein